ncbi:hypothetical protein SBOR_5324 [Sclerotinia borealis F-4128]|uniref:Ketoreductase (KR) domain-containing protein n=1 Tax=Sclerotinia borealis (strain F-4128) TaxID=1432307 RepID=W9CEN8_SCLBF|nr:hypothetical protein SBOR_5324 [Sclerotinia borealis F-4128]
MLLLSLDGTLNVLSKFQSRSKKQEVDPELEYTIHDGVVHITHFHWISIPDELCSTATSKASKRWDIEMRGLLKTLRCAQERGIEVKDDEVSLDDILHTLGIIDEIKTQLVTLVTELTVQGCTVQIVAGSFANLADIQCLISEARFPIAGIIQVSVVLKDGEYFQMTHKDWESFKHQCFKLGVRSMESMGQVQLWLCQHILDAFSQYRHGQGLPTSAIDVGVMDSSRNGTLDTLQLAIVKSSPMAQVSRPLTDGYTSESQIVIGYKMTMPITRDNNRNVWKRDVRLSLYRNLDNYNLDDSATSNEGPKKLLVTVSNNPRILKDPFLAKEIGKTLFSFMMPFS